ncbi:hypothetical protein [Xanthobacter wiegelii]|uniref:hypothetical protein n=1 Tax=Xanthobacter wiegelii TaxID=3119913 RepID=UPI003727A67D
MLDAFVSGAISWLLAIVTGSALLIGVAALVYSRLPALSYRLPATIAGGALLLLAGWTGHASDRRDEQERQALLAANRALVKEVTSERLKVEGLQADARKAAENLKAATERAEAAEAVAATLPDAALSDATSDAIRNLWRR